MAEKSWRPSRKKYGVALANFRVIVRHGLPLTVGDTVHILEEYGGDQEGWYRGCRLCSKEQLGIFPKCLIAEKECEVDNPGRYETITPVEDIVVQELTFGLQEWLRKWKMKYLEQEFGPMFSTVNASSDQENRPDSEGWCSVIHKLRRTMQELISLRGRLINGTVSIEQKKDLKDEIVTLLDWGNGQLGMDLVPRKEGEQLDADATSIVELYRVHVQSAEHSKSAEPRRTQVTPESRNSKESIVVQNINVMFKTSQCNIGETAFIYVSVFNSKDDKFISEQFEIEVNRNGLPANQEKIDSLYALFTDISSEEMSRNLYLVARIYRFGKMLSDNSNKKAPLTPYRRPWGVGVFSIDEVKNMSTRTDLYEAVMKVQSCVDNEQSFSELHKSLINRMMNQGSSSKLSVGTGASAPDKQNLGLTFAVRIIPGELKTVQAENPVMFTKGVAVIQKLDFSEIITPGEVRNDLYITLTEGDFEKDGKKSQKNVELRMSVYDVDGKLIKECMSFGTTDKGQLLDTFTSGTYYHNNSPKWGETVRVSIPMDVFPGSHVRFEIFHCSRNTSRGKAEKRLCGFAYMRLTDDSRIVIQDASHALCIYKCEDVSKIKYMKYKSLPFLSDDFNDPRSPGFSHGGKNANLPYPRTKEMIHVTTKLCSTKFTQTSQLLGILQWKERQNEIESNLDQMMKLQGLEIMKFLQDILDKVFDMLTQGASKQCSYCTKVFHALVFILNLLLDSRFENFIPVLDNYLQEHFAFPVVHKYLTECFATGIQKAVAGEHFPVAMSLKVLDQLVRFIVRSRELEQSTSVFKRMSDPESDFLQRIQDLFNSFGALLTNREVRLKISQMALLANLHKSFVPFSSVLTKPQIAQFVVQVMTQKHKDMPDDVARNKMEFVKEVINSDLFLEADSRQIVLPMCLTQIKVCLVEKNFLQLTTSSLGDLLSKLFILKMEHKDLIKKDITRVTDSLFQIILDLTLTLSEKVVPTPVLPANPDLQSPSSAVAPPINQIVEVEEEEITNPKSTHRKNKERRRTLTQGLFGTVQSKCRPTSSNITCQPLPIATSPSSNLPLTDLSAKLITHQEPTGKPSRTPAKKVPYVSMEDLGISETSYEIDKDSISVGSSSHLDISLSPFTPSQPIPILGDEGAVKRHRSSTFFTSPSSNSPKLPQLSIFDWINKAEKKRSSTFSTYAPPELDDEFQLTYPALISAKGEMIACLADMLRLMEDRHYSNIVTKMRHPPILGDFLTRVLLTFQELIKDEVFSSDWSLMRLVTNNVIFTAVEYFSDTLRLHFLERERFNEALWNHYFNFAVSFITQPSLQLETFSSAKRQKIKDRYHDMRLLMGQQMKTLWENLGSNRRHFIPSMIGPFLKVTLVPEEELRKTTLPIFFDMMECEQRTSGSFLLVENEIIERLDQYITTESYGDDDYRLMFKSTLLDKVQAEPDLQDKGSQFIVSVTSLLERLLDYRQCYDGDENSDKRMHCTFNILNFYKDNNNREEMYVRYIKKLYDLHLSAQNYVEAGLTLQLYAQILQWRDTPRKDELDYPMQAEWERKERVYIQVIDCFDKGKVWEYGIPLCKELAELYERRLDYRKLSSILEKQAKFFSNILDGVEVYEEGSNRAVFYPRQEPTYFRVAYYGQSFPPFVRNKAFIYRGDECLKLQDIINHLMQEFPAATIMSTNNPVDEAKKTGDAQYIQICSVKALPDDRPEFVRCGGVVPTEIKNFYNSNDVDTFQFDRSFHRGEKDRNCEFKTLCTERTIMKTSYRFPGILQWYEVVNTDTIVLTPVYTAIENIRTATESLQKEIEKCQKNSCMDTAKSLSMKLQGMISANVNGGIPKYQEAFFVPEYVFLHPEEADGVAQLKQLITEQVTSLDKGMHLMKTVNKVRSAGLGELLKSLSEMLRELKRSTGLNVHDRSSSVASTFGRRDSGVSSMFLDASCAETSGSGSQHSSGSNRSSMHSGDTLSQEGDIYDEPPPEEPLPFSLPPPMPEKKRFSLFSPVGQLITGDRRVVGGASANATPHAPPRRPLSLVLYNRAGCEAHQWHRTANITGSDSNIHKAVPSTSSQTVTMTTSVSTGHLERPSEQPPRLARKESAPPKREKPKLISRRPTDLSSQVNGEGKPTLPLKKKPSMEKIPERVSNVPPLPPRKASSSTSRVSAAIAALNPSPEPVTRRQVPHSLSNTSVNSDSSDNVFTDAPPIPVRKSKLPYGLTPPVPAPRNSYDKEHENTKM